MKKNDTVELAARLLCLILISVIAYISIKYLLAYVLPFLLAWALGCAVRFPARTLNRRTHIPTKICALFMIFVILALIIALGALLTDAVITFGGKAAELVSQRSDSIAKYLSELPKMLASLGSNEADEISESLEIMLNNALQRIAEHLGTSAATFAARIVGSLPDAILALTVTVVASFYFALDIDLVNDKIKQLLPEKATQVIEKIRTRAARGVKKYLGAYLALYLITFSQLLIGFLLLGIDDPTAVAALVAFVDMLPVLGTAAVLLPWGVIALLLGEYFLGFGLLALLAVMSLIRQVIEPKIVGKSLGVHPLVTLVAMYAGYAALGAIGMIVAPIVTAIFLAGEEEGERDEKY